MKDSTLVVFRAEEHTAQISAKRSDEDAYTQTELYELMFQDIPIQSFEIDLGERILQPPIDILSLYHNNGGRNRPRRPKRCCSENCSTTCCKLPTESGTCRKRFLRSKYGINMLIDNSAYAQSSFQRPEQIVSHPDAPPRLYLNANKKIRQRAC